MGTKLTNGIQFTTRYWLQGKVRTFIKELDYSIEEVSGFDRLHKEEKDELLEWKYILLKHLKTKLIACYSEIVDDLSCEDSAIFRLCIGTERLKDSPED